MYTDKDESSRIAHQTTRWLLNGERGMSSEAMVRKISPAAIEFRSNARAWDHPHDMDDFRRCEVALRQIEGLRDHFPEMAEVSVIWDNLVRHWSEIVSLAEASAPGFFVPRWEMDRSNRSSVGSAARLLRSCLGRDES